MAEYIEREALLEKRWDVPFETEDSHFVQVVDVVDIIAAPPADVAPVRHGRWIGKNSPYDVNIHICSVCRGQVSILGNKLRFCPNCGAKMDGGDQDA